MNNRMKYYMRGLGFGIIVTTVILSIANRNAKLTDESAIKRAKELGYVLADSNNSSANEQKIDIEAIKAQLTPPPSSGNDNSTPIVSVTPIVTEEPVEVVTPAATETPTPTVFVTATPAPTNTLAPTFTPAPTATVTPAPKPTSEPRGYVVAVGPYDIEDVKTYGCLIGWPREAPVNKYITVDSGLNCYEICNKLHEEGVLNDANAFSKYVVYYGMDYYLRPGEFYFSSDMTFDTILSTLTGNDWWWDYSE